MWLKLNVFPSFFLWNTAFIWETCDHLFLQIISSAEEKNLISYIVLVLRIPLLPSFKKLHTSCLHSYKNMYILVILYIYLYILNNELWHHNFSKSWCTISALCLRKQSLSPLITFLETYWNKSIGSLLIYRANIRL